jgi:hypothetical protein
VDGRATIAIERPRSIAGLLGATVDLYFRVPILFLALAAIVVVPYELAVLAVTGAGPLAVGRTGFVTSNLVSIADYFLATPLISAFHVHAVREAAEGRRPRLVTTLRQSLSTLPIVAIAAGVGWVGITIGLFALVVPGILLLARWAVVAQTAALEPGGWTDALRRSAALTEGERWHSFGLVITAGLISMVPWLGLSAAFGHKSTTVGSFAAGTALQILIRSFSALTTALLYFDLKARMPMKADRATTGDAKEASPAGRDETRPAGWYIDPSSPKRMRYWAADGTETWSRHTARTPKPLLREWLEHQGAGGPSHSE